MSNSKALDELKDLISMVLDDCDRYDYPHVCNMATNPNTRENLEKTVLDMCLATGWPVQAAILQVERAHNPNMLDD
jgi:hypothetical protein